VKPYSRPNTFIQLTTLVLKKQSELYISESVTIISSCTSKVIVVGGVLIVAFHKVAKGKLY